MTTRVAYRLAGRFVRGIGLLPLDTAAPAVADTDAAVAATNALGCQVQICGSIANRPDLGRQLGLSHAAADDAILVAHAFRKWGRRLSAHVLGEYAAVVYDRHAGAVLLTHDSLGLFPLYVMQRQAQDRDADFAFATHLLDLLDDDAAARLDEEYVADFLARGYIDTERTPFPDIRRLLPGHSVEWADGRLAPFRHWSLAAVEPRASNETTAREPRLLSLLEAGVQGAVDGAGVVWSQLSGGLDSSTVTSVAARLGAPGLSAWSAYCPSYPQADERRWMRDVVDAYPMPWHLIDAEQTPPFSTEPGAFIGEPTIAVVNDAIVGAADRLFAAHGVDVVLSGHGGDAVLGAHVGPEVVELADPLFAFDPLGALRGVRRWQRESPERRSYTYWLRHSLLLPAAQHLRGEAVRIAAQMPLQPWLAADYVRRMRLDRRRLQPAGERCATPGRQRLADSLHVAALQVARDRQRRRAVDMRHPLLYRPLVEFMCAVPFDQRTRPRCDRYLQRRALKGILPESVRRRASKGVGTPSFANGLACAPDWIDYLTHDSRLAAHGIADAARWRLAVKQAAVGQTHGDQFFHAGVAVEVWLRQLEAHRAKRRQPSSGSRMQTS